MEEDLRWTGILDNELLNKMANIPSIIDHSINNDKLILHIENGFNISKLELNPGDTIRIRWRLL